MPCAAAATLRSISAAVTTLFADIKGSMWFMEELDPGFLGSCFLISSAETEKPNKSRA